ncbi:piwi-like protein Siwi isoform X2 [Sipha flava]|nr:piwi-like protein Siwi isoform X2 [Sipha flava]XP_025413440.1 piwi-like protein Siwi isoform X2 [Sipha flava]
MNPSDGRGRARGRGRGLARGQSQPIRPANQQGSPTQAGNPRFAGPRPAQPRSGNTNVPRVPGPRTSRPSIEEVTTKFSEMETGTPIPIGRGAIRGREPIVTPQISYYRAPRPESSKSQTGKQGASGQPVSLISNYFPIKTYTNWTLYQYRVDFSPEEDKVMVRRGLLSNHKDFLGAYLFEGTMLFSSKKYKSDKFELTSKRNSDGQIFIITVTYTSVLEPGDYAYLQVFNLLLRNCLRHLELKLIGRNYYDPVAKICIEKLRLQLWPGYETTIGMFDSGLLLRSEISTKVMREETVYDLLQEFMRESHRDRDWFIKFKAAVIGTTVLTNYNNQTYRIDDVDDKSTIKSTFPKKDGTQMSYIDYYHQKWNIKLKNVGQPLLISKKKKNVLDKSDTDRAIYLIPELCILTGLSQSMSDNRMMMRELAEFTRVNPRERIIRYNKFMNRLLSTPKSVETLKNWNLEPGKNLVNINGRVLPPQKIACNTHQFSAGDRGDWSNALRNAPMYTSASIKRWAIVAPQNVMADVQKFLGSLKRVSDAMSFFLPRPDIIPIPNPTIKSYTDAFENAINGMNPSFIMCIIPSNRGDTYSAIKRHLCVFRAVPSQVIVLRNVQNNNLSVITKIAIQINSKLGCAPWLVKIPRKNMLIIGFDVCHDKQNKNKSFGALVASINDEQTVYYSCVTEHVSGQELSDFFTANMTKVLHAYRSHNNKLPSGIMIYRDGVGDGQLSYVHKTELANIKSVCKEFYKDEEESPQLAFIIVKKRISTRFFTSGQNPQNPPPGTIIDSVVTDPTMYDFYLISQHVGQGTVTPTHYNVIEDTFKDWSPDKMQQVTYKLTHMYFNWSGTVRVPALCQYAHKLAFFASQILRGTPNTGLNQLLYFL